MKNLVFAFALLCSTSLSAQFEFNSTNGSGIQSVFENIATGTYATAMGYQTTASGNFSTAMGKGTIASGGRSTVMGEGTSATGAWSTAIGLNTEASGEASTTMGKETIASGSNSAAMGYRTTASGNYSTSIGNYTEASGSASTAMGIQTKAIGNYSTAMGWKTNSNGVLSTAMGWYTVAQDFGTIATGIFNETNDTPNPNTFTPQNTALVIGNGTDDENRSNAFEVLFDGTTTIAGNVTAPAFIGDGSQLTNLPTPTVDYSDITNTPLSFNENGTGIQTSYTTASGKNSTAFGGSTDASGDYSIAMGQLTTAGGDYSTAMGIFSQASGNLSTAMGYYTTASGYASTASGQSTTASGFVSTAMGEFTEASGSFSTAMGQGTSAKDYGTIAIGVFNKTKETSNPNQYSLQNTAFVIGNGLSDNRSNAFEVLFDGTTTIAGDLNINSDARLKANIISLGATLSKLLQIDGKTYTMKKDANHKKKIGLLAQDIEKVFPELVTETNDIKSVNYQGLVPVLINAMKEQDDKITKQQQEIDELKTMVKQLMSK